MELSGNTILITGGGSGIGRGLAEAFHRLGNKVIVAGRRRSAVDEVVAANPGMEAATADVQDGAAIAGFAAEIARRFPALNVLINNAGIMRNEDLTSDAIDVSAAEATIATNLLAPIRLTAALLPHLKKQQHAAVLNVTSGLAFVPMAITPTYCATKAAVHSWTESLRFQLRNTSVEVKEIVPPYVQTELQGERQANDPMAMPLKDFIAETMAILKSDPHAAELCVDRVRPLRNAAERGGEAYRNTFARLNQNR